MTRTLAPPAPKPPASGRRPTFSVVVAAYQTADVIGDALESLEQQTTAPLEVIVCDDGSTDEIEEVVTSYEGVVFIRKEHGGEASAKNAAAARATGDFLAILDADDVYLPRRLEALGGLAAERPDLDILTTDAYLVAGGRRVRRNYGPSWRFEVADQRRAILQRNFVFGHAAVRRTRFLEHGGFDESILWTTDWDLWLRLILDGSRVGLVDEPLALYRLRETSLTSRRRELALGRLATLEKARRNGHLTAEDRLVVNSSLAAYRRELALVELKEALRDCRPDSRRLARAVALDRGVPVGRRAEAAAAAIAPQAATRVLRRRAARYWTGAGGIRVRRDGSAPARPLRVLTYTDTLELGGADIALSHLVAALDSDVEVAVTGVTPEIVQRIARGRPDSKTAFVLSPASDHDIRSLRAHVGAIRSFRPDIVHASLASPWSCQYAIAAAALLRQPRIVAVYQLPRPALGSRQRLAKRITSLAVDAHVGVGKRTSAEVAHLLGLAPNVVRTVHNGVPSADVERLPRPVAGPLVGSAGRLAPQKGFDDLLRALASVEDATLVLAGAGPEGESLERLAGELGVAERVIWLGWRDDVRGLLATLDVFVLPSRFEGFPLVLLEAMLAGTPVVAADVGSVAEAVLDGETGLLVPPGDPAALATAVRRLLADETLRSRLATAGRQHVLAHFSAEAMTRSFRELYDELLL